MNGTISCLAAPPRPSPAEGHDRLPVGGSGTLVPLDRKAPSYHSPARLPPYPASLLGAVAGVRGAGP
jgi:hypothetical protein